MIYQYPFSNVKEQYKRSVWDKGIIEIHDDKDKDVWRRDICGNAIKYSEHGNTNSDYGWEIDHINPSANGGSDDLANLQPLQWENNRQKGDTYPWPCK